MPAARCSTRRSRSAGCGVPVGFFSGLSSDLFGQQLRDVLAASHVSAELAAISERPTTLAFVRLVDGHATYTFYDENTAGRMLTEADLPALPAAVDAMLFGAISLIPEPCGSTYEALMRREHERRVTMLDPNIRPGFIPDRAKHLERIRRMMAMADIVKLSDEDLGWFGEAGTAEEVIARWLDAGPKLIVMTRGSARRRRLHQARHGDGRGTHGHGGRHGRRRRHVQRRPAGLPARERGAQQGRAGRPAAKRRSRAALAFGVKAAAVTVSRAGANPPWRDELE